MDFEAEAGTFCYVFVVKGLRTSEEVTRFNMGVSENVNHEFRKTHLASREDLAPDSFPQLYNLSAAFIYQFMYHPINPGLPEYVYIPPMGSEPNVKTSLFIADWNFAWEAAELRHQLLEDKVPPELDWLKKFEGSNIYLVPRCERHQYYGFAPIFHLLPQRILTNHGLPLIKKGLWPHCRADYWLEKLIPNDFDQRLSHAFARYIWKHIDSGSRIEAFSELDSLRLLAHNLDFWLPYLNMVIVKRMCQFLRTEIETKKQRRLLKQRRAELPPDILLNRPLKGGYVWCGEEDADEIVREMVEIADCKGRLRAIIDAVRSTRVEEDFSNCWSYAREDFERKLYCKRSKIRVSFVQLDDTIPVHGPESEIHEGLLWEDFLALLDTKERRIVVLLRNGHTKLRDIAKELGYANHSPVSKALARIRLKAEKYLQ